MKNTYGINFACLYALFTIMGSVSATESNQIGSSQVNFNNSEYFLVNAPEPEYPAVAKFNRYEGFVKLRISFDREGKVVEIDILDAENIKIFKKEVIKTVMNWTIEPHNKDLITIDRTFDFRMQTCS